MAASEDTCKPYHRAFPGTQVGKNLAETLDFEWIAFVVLQQTRKRSLAERFGDGLRSLPGDAL